MAIQQLLESNIMPSKILFINKTGMTDKSDNVHAPCRTPCSRASGKSDSLLLLLHSQHQTLTQRTKHVSQSRSAPTPHAEGYCQCQSWYIVGLEQLIDGESALQDLTVELYGGSLDWRRHAAHGKPWATTGRGQAMLIIAQKQTGMGI